MSLLDSFKAAKGAPPGIFTLPIVDRDRFSLLSQHGMLGQAFCALSHNMRTIASGVATGTGITLATSFSEQSAYLTIRNKDSAGGKAIIPLGASLFWITSGGGTGQTNTQYFLTVDSGTNRITGGTALDTQNTNLNIDPSNNASIAEVLVQPTIAAPNASRPIGYQLITGTTAMGQFSALSLSVGLTASLASTQPVLYPGNNETLLWHVWHPSISQTTLTALIKVDWLEVPTTL